MDTWVQDIRFGLRMLFKRPGFTLTAVLTLAIGIGANTAMFSILDAVLLKSLPYPAPEQLMMVWESNPNGQPRNWVSPPNFVDWRSQNQVFQSMSAYQYGSFNLAGTASPERVSGMLVTADFFQTLQVGPVLGRTFAEGEDTPGREQVLLLGRGYWISKYNADPDIIGRTVIVNDAPHTVVGVMPDQFQVFNADISMWKPLTAVTRITSRGSHQLRIVARMHEGVTLDEARAEMQTIGARLAEAYPASNKGWGVNVFALQDDIVHDVEGTLWLLAGAVGFVLLLACTNVANLMLTRAAGRTREIAIRTAMGARRFRVVRQLLTESVIMALTGGLLGCVLALWAADLIVRFSPVDLPRLAESSIDMRVLGITLVISLVTGLLAGLAPALYACKPAVYQYLKEGGRTASTGTERKGFRNALVVIEVAVTVILLVSAGLLTRSMINLYQVDPGFRTDNLLTVRMMLSNTTYPDEASRIAFYRNMLQRVDEIPGVQQASLISDVPLTGGIGYWKNGFFREGQPPVTSEDRTSAYLRWVSPGYFETMGISLQQGRLMNERDTAETPPVVVIDERMARMHFPDTDPIGVRISVNSRLYEIVGIVSPVHQTALDLAPEPHMYVPYFQTPQSYTTLVIRTGSAPMSYVGQVREAVRSVDPNQPVFLVRTMEDVLNVSIGLRRFSMWVIGFFAGAALLLAMIGVYGVVAYTVSQRTHEIGIRMAIGARRMNVFAMIMQHGLVLTGIGLAVGIAGSLVMTQLLSSLLFNVSAVDPVTILLQSALLVVITLLACYIPARRATKVDPMTALRCE